jgi:hypothetical protein
VAVSPDLNFVERAILKHELKKYLGRLFEMKLTTHLIWQGLAMVLQYGDQATDIVPPKGKPFVALAIGLAQALLALAGSLP